MAEKLYLILTVKYPGYDHTVDVFTSAEGSAGAKVSIHKALAWSALTFDSSKVDSRTTGVRQLNYGAAYGSSTTTDDELGVDVGNTVSNVSAASLANEQVMGETTQLTFTLAARSWTMQLTCTMYLSEFSSPAWKMWPLFEHKMGSTMSRLEFQQINLSRQRTNMEAANGRIKDVDMGRRQPAWQSTVY